MLPPPPLCASATYKGGLAYSGQRSEGRATFPSIRYFPLFRRTALRRVPGLSSSTPAIPRPRISAGKAGHPVLACLCRPTVRATRLPHPVQGAHLAQPFRTAQYRACHTGSKRAVWKGSKREPTAQL